MSLRLYIMPALDRETDRQLEMPPQYRTVHCLLKRDKVSKRLAASIVQTNKQKRFLRKSFSSPLTNS